MGLELAALAREFDQGDVRLIFRELPLLPLRGLLHAAAEIVLAVTVAYAPGA